MPERQKNRSLGFLSCALASSLWGCGFYFGKIALVEMNVGAMILCRFLFATLALTPLLLTHWRNFRSTRFSRQDWSLLLISSFLGIPLLFFIQFSGLSHTTVSHASLMVGAMPVLLAVAAALFAHERMNRSGWLALSLSTLGAMLIALGARHASGANQPTLYGDLLVLFSLLIGMVWILLNQRLLRHHSTVVVTTYGIVCGTAMLFALVLLLNGPPHLAHLSLRVWLALAASGLFCTASTTLLWNWGITQIPASQAGVLLNMEPLAGSLLGVFLLHESLGPSARTGGGMILFAAVLISTRGHMHSSEPLPVV
jgi:drug/metabolite transporter (DMT)-like permease